MTTRVFQDGEVLRLGTQEEFAELWYDVSANILRIQAPTSSTSNTPVDMFDFAVAGTIYNEGGADRDYRAEGDTNANLFVMDAGTDSVSHGGAVVAGAAFSLNNVTARTQVTSVGQQLHVPAQTFNDSGGAATKAIFASQFWGTQTLTGTNAITYTDAATVYLAAGPAASTNITITNATMALWVDAGRVRFDGTTTLNTVTYTWPSADGAAGTQLQTDGAGVLSWAAAGSLREYKNLLGEFVEPNEALSAILAVPVHSFQYKPSERLYTADSGVTWRHWGTGDTKTVYTGVVADEAPWVMHHNGAVFSPMNAFGYTALAIKALQAEIDDLRETVDAQARV